MKIKSINPGSSERPALLHGKAFTRKFKKEILFNLICISSPGDATLNNAYKPAFFKDNGTIKVQMVGNKLQAGDDFGSLSTALIYNNINLNASGEHMKKPDTRSLVINNEIKRNFREHAGAGSNGYTGIPGEAGNEMPFKIIF